MANRTSNRAIRRILASGKFKISFRVSNRRLMVVEGLYGCGELYEWVLRTKLSARQNRAQERGANQ
jgi:hypothetical protein